MNKYSFIPYKYALLMGSAVILSIPIFLFAQITEEERTNSASMRESATQQALQNTQELINAQENRSRDSIPEGSVRERGVGGGTTASDDWANPVLRQTNEEVTQRINPIEERRNQMQTDIANRQAELQARGEERRAMLQNRAQERLLNLAANMSNRMEAAVRRLTNVSNRMDSRITKLEDTGINTAEARNHLTTARNHLASATSALSNIDTDVVQFITSNDPRSAWVRVKSIYDTARSDIRSAHESLRQALASLGQAIADQQQTDELAENE